MSDDEDKHQDTVDALNALTNEDLDAEPHEAAEQKDFDPMSVIGDAIPAADEAPMIDLAPDAVDPSSTLRRRSAQVHARTQQAHTHQLKSIAIPLLITVGLLLFLCSIIAIGQVASASGDPDAIAAINESLLPMSYRQAFPVAGFPIGAFLLFGAYHFRKEMQQVRQADKRSRGEAG